MTYEELGKYDISNFNFKDRNSIPILNTVKIDKYNWGRIDIIINQFCNGEIDYLPILLDFNKISNPFDLKLGSYINIPDFNHIMMVSEMKEIDEVKIPGVNESMNCKEVNRKLSSIINNSSSGESAPKLGALKKVTYNPDKGTITY